MSGEEFRVNCSEVRCNPFANLGGAGGTNFFETVHLGSILSCLYLVPRPVDR